ncbi:MAG: YceI family protein [Bacteroidetes bacterium]|jgi:polyisoprenoid-binding protein YceI|nr:YceI family protein [Bacteroidota bacterium]
MKKIAAIFLLAIFSGLAFTYIAKQTIIKSAVTFQIKNLGINIGGNFSGLKADINFDPAHLETSSIEASVQANTINTDNETRDHHLKSDSYFDADKYPEIKMKSVSFKHNSGNNYTGTFNLTIKDKTNQVQVPFTYTENSNDGEFKGSFKIKRTDYGVGGRSMVMSNDVTISIDVSTSK